MCSTNTCNYCICFFIPFSADKFTEILGVRHDSLMRNCLNRALVFATRNNNHYNVSRLLVMGASNLEECLRIAKQERKPRARAMLLLMKAAQTGDESVIQKIFNETALAELEDDSFADVQESVCRGKVSAIVPFEIARRNGYTAVMGEFLLKTNVNKKKGFVYWHNLKLQYLENLWLKKISWVKKLRLSGNILSDLPLDIGTYLKQVKKCEYVPNTICTEYC